MIGFGQVRHTRLAPKHHAFVYPTYFLMLPMRSLQNSPGQLPLNRRAALSFYDCDHGDGRGPQQGGALLWLEELLRSEGITDADGEIWLHCYPRVLGFTFKPVSFWYCHRADGSLRAVLVEVNTTFGERHCYFLSQARFGVEQRADKVFHVSPFCPVQGQYRFRFMVNAQGDRTVARIDYDDMRGPLIQSSVSGLLQPYSVRAARYALWRYPLMTMAVVWRIHWQALRLSLKRVPFFRQPPAPESFVSR